LLVVIKVGGKTNLSSSNTLADYIVCVNDSTDALSHAVCEVNVSTTLYLLSYHTSYCINCLMYFM